ncbi:uncharacterized protein FPRO_15825 [Fusarium proliferatum ET1]|uniref:Uncharacterized protein n=1 Tax=Fusarium proliferatum (strain ET1) TaxID=1227346 RepID=A0A1L7WA58_FUSPR|nr:uncharacterized protein FPRO_15825 [Fusarium proliferatum ET1]CZR49465.1 uncharacterized protein FPRO_15825 [Fusarium proliferatum ET1]
MYHSTEAQHDPLLIFNQISARFFTTSSSGSPRSPRRGRYPSIELEGGSTSTLTPTPKRPRSSAEDRPGTSKIPRTDDPECEDTHALSQGNQSDDGRHKNHQPDHDELLSDDELSSDDETYSAIAISDPPSPQPYITRLESEGSPTSTATLPGPSAVTATYAETALSKVDESLHYTLKSIQDVRTELERNEKPLRCRLSTSLRKVESLEAELERIADELGKIRVSLPAFHSLLLIETRSISPSSSIMKGQMPTKRPLKS